MRLWLAYERIRLTCDNWEACNVFQFDAPPDDYKSTED